MSRPLTTRQRQMLERVQRGLSNKEIARELNLAPPTVKVHVAAMLLAIRCRNRTEAAAQAHRWLDTPTPPAFYAANHFERNHTP